MNACKSRRFWNRMEEMEKEAKQPADEDEEDAIFSLFYHAF
jgi:hypothetical protein